MRIRARFFFFFFFLCAGFWCCGILLSMESGAKGSHHCVRLKYPCNSESGIAVEDNEFHFKFLPLLLVHDWGRDTSCSYRLSNWDVKLCYVALNIYQGLKKWPRWIYAIVYASVRTVILSEINEYHKTIEKSTLAIADPFPDAEA
ncbi:hypothetical protein B0J12DRAFT_636754 [Macrophomina phaseolina]|uniref:Uncharacterized protein n=1 Tax=Macrophomina phaseolina TaxID=35725 RepID=A0ABQ8GTE9_9PEZI|nr:hypothetical protein B0J12DRAFT_636754 [Macrophomina phaseolina]